ncbi:MAG: hypothetical protein JST00_19140 [Deltaproteobacteria bacterium]|nr:hypothetical protein [Deltaproteobacteria bacterium]
MRPRAIVLGLFPLAVVIGAAHGCRDATQATIRISTSATCADVRDVAITVAGEAVSAEERGATYPTTTTSTCNGGLIGTLVLTPGSEGDAAALVVAAGVLVPSDQCKPPAYAGCIVARRRFSFIEHVALTLPVSLDLDCTNVPCDATSTCFRGACVDSRIVCTESGCADLAGTTSGGRDAGEAGDASKADATSDAPTDAPIDAPTDGDGATDPCAYNGPNEGNAWTQFSCLNGAGQFCVGYTIGHCANESAYGTKCNTGPRPICGPSICSATDKTSTVYRCLKDWCVYGCGPGGAPDFGAEPVGIVCGNMAGCGP